MGQRERSSTSQQERGGSQKRFGDLQFNPASSSTFSSFIPSFTQTSSPSPVLDGSLTSLGSIQPGSDVGFEQSEQSQVKK